ncbi:MAG: TAT-variant-translocated molybdopterin oxidoreductase [Bacteroidetes bacterium]|nr:TAT-variant-translocated molybdopterin oxidoreductase [Bacteroidota bacterium]
MAEKIYWKGLEEKEDTEGFRAIANKEFSEELPVLNSIVEPISTGNSNRRDFLKMLGFSVSAAVVAASCEMPVRKSIPYVWRPEEIAPGIANFYATTFYQGGDYTAVIVKTREGRPIKIEGRNKKHARVTKGGTSARTQASVLSLYDGARYKGPKSGKENITWETADKEIGEKLKAAASTGKVVLFSSSVISPSTKAVIADFGKSLGDKFEHLVYDGVSYSGMLDANEKSFGKRLIPSYNFANAKLIVGVGADFLGTWLSPVEFSADYAINRRVAKDRKEMSRHIQIESVPTITGYKSDTRIPVSPSDELSALVDIYNVVTGSGSAKNEKVGKAAQELLAAKGTSLVVSGSNDMNAQLLANAINNALGNYGSTITWDRPYNTKQGSDKAVTSLISGLNDGSIKGVLFYESNPVFTSSEKGLAEALKKADVSVSFANRLDETSLACGYVCPDSHWLESWNDAEPKAGIFNTAQPAISKLFDTRQVQETLMRWSGNAGSYYEFIQKYWESNIYPKQKEYPAFWAFWDNVVADGEVETATTSSASFNGVGVGEAASALAATSSSLNGVQVKFYESIAVGDGYWSDNPWLQELPDPVSKITWDNYILANPSWMVKNGYNLDPDFKEKRYAIAKLTANGQSVELPVVGVPGTPVGTFGIAVGYGREAVAHDELKIGKNVFQMFSKSGDNFTDIAKATIENTGKSTQVAITQTHFNITLKDLGGVHTRKVVKETTLKEYQKNLAAGNEDRAEILEEMVTLYYKHDRPGQHWTMVVDLNTCTGCGSCVVACNAENNVPVVGKDEVRRSREMHWMRIDRYYTGTVDNPDVVFQPMLCQHCDNAPCENVCPVAATNHSSEGLNQMAYNRCIGTRYCANNCPYKVRRFNWYDYQQADAFDKKYHTSNDMHVASETLGLHEPLTRMVLNPDVTVRSRGVMEKCSFCVQRLQSGKLEAKKGSRPLTGLVLDPDGTVKEYGDIHTACQTACPTNAITFGDRNNKESEVSKKFADERAFGVIEEIHTMPNVLYLTQVRNREEEKKYEVIDYYHEKA